MTFKLNVENNIAALEKERSGIQQRIEGIQKEMEVVRRDVRSFNEKKDAFLNALFRERQVGFCSECQDFVAVVDMLTITWKEQRCGGDIYTGRWTEEVDAKGDVCNRCFSEVAKKKAVRVLTDPVRVFQIGDSSQITWHAMDNINKLDLGFDLPNDLKRPEFK